MDIENRIAVVTGAASGIGQALSQALADAGAAHVVCADLNGEGAAATARQVGGTAHQVDVGQEADIQRLIEVT